MLYNFEQFSLLRQLSKIDSMHEEKIKHEMIDDVWNSRRQPVPAQKEPSYLYQL